MEYLGRVEQQLKADLTHIYVRDRALIPRLGFMVSMFSPLKVPVTLLSLEGSVKSNGDVDAKCQTMLTFSNSVGSI